MVSRYSKVRKEIRRNSVSEASRVKSFIVIAILVLALSAIALVSYYKFFRVRFKDAVDLVPQDIEITVAVENPKDQKQKENLDALGKKLGGFNPFDTLLPVFLGRKLANTTVDFEKDIKPWVAGDLLWSRKTLSSQKEAVLFLPVGDPQSRDVFLEKIGSESDAVSKNRYKGIEVVNLLGDQPITYAK